MPTEFKWKRLVQFAETDLAGVLHFANYYRYMEEAEHAFWRSLGSSVITRNGDREISWPRAATSCEYLAPVHFEDELELTVVLAKIGNRSIRFEYDFRRGGEHVARGTSTAVCAAMKNGTFQSIVIPPSIRSKLEQAVGST